MHEIELAQIQPRVRISNHHQCRNEQRWPQRRLIDLQFIYVLKGQLFYRIEGQELIEVDTDNVLCIFPTQRHDLWASSSQAVISGIHCELSQGAWASRDYRCHPRPTVLTIPDPEQGLAEQFQLCARVFSSYQRYAQERCNAICRSIILGLGEHWQDGNEPMLSKRMLAMIEFIREHMAEPIGRQDLAQAFYLTPEHINFIFKQEIQMTPSEVINRERCLRAHQLLIDGASVKEAAHQVGFNDPLFFSRVFKKYFQVPPSKI